MARIQIVYAGVHSANQTLQKAITEMTLVESTLVSLKQSVDPDIQSRYQIADKLRKYHQSAKDIRDTSKRLLDTAKSGVLDYQKTETRLRRAVPEDQEEMETR